MATTTKALTGKPISAAKPEVSAPKTADTVRLKAICAEMKLDPRLAREKLRIAAYEPKKFPELAKAHKPRSGWEWVKRSQAEKEARAALTA
ncbi:hypothetical protein QM467_12615 [Rhodoblastus sp. 17X3]|uniref:hypothetical protein n=1 Tax=Rhodoblastus sp. 17X3 TaxID=3047026 RepID=UPI0024B6E8B3|nr:hypothetical protein [Rhodoblastus sp. 17X3]MDI9848901.1 hypothetical protein [Rhodoblastus sp. 17X3]